MIIFQPFLLGYFLLLQSLVKSTSPTIGYAPDIEHDVEVPSAHEQEFSFNDLLTFPIIISISNYFILAFLSIAVNALLPLFYHMPISMGGLDLDPAAIGYLMGMYGAGTGLFQLLFFCPNRATIWHSTCFYTIVVDVYTDICDVSCD